MTVVVVNSTTYSFAPFNEKNQQPETWSYDPNDLAVVIALPPMKLQEV